MIKASEKKESVQVFEFDQAEVIECFSSYLKTRSIYLPEKAHVSFEVKVGPTSRELELIKVTAKVLEEGAIPTNGKGEAKQP